MKELDTLCVVAFILFVAWAIETLRDSKMALARRFWFSLALTVLCAAALVVTWHAANARDLGQMGGRKAMSGGRTTITGHAQAAPSEADCFGNSRKFE